MGFHVWDGPVAIASCHVKPKLPQQDLVVIEPNVRSLCRSSLVIHMYTSSQILLKNPSRCSPVTEIKVDHGRPDAEDRHDRPVPSPRTRALWIRLLGTRLPEATGSKAPHGPYVVVLQRHSLAPSSVYASLCLIKYAALSQHPGMTLILHCR